MALGSVNLIAEKLLYVGYLPLTTRLLVLPWPSGGHERESRRWSQPGGGFFI